MQGNLLKRLLILCLHFAVLVSQGSPILCVEQTEQNLNRASTLTGMPVIVCITCNLLAICEAHDILQVD